MTSGHTRRKTVCNKAKMTKHVDQVHQYRPDASIVAEHEQRHSGIGWTELRSQAPLQSVQSRDSSPNASIGAGPSRQQKISKEKAGVANIKGKGVSKMHNQKQERKDVRCKAKSCQQCRRGQAQPTARHHQDGNNVAKTERRHICDQTSRKRPADAK